MAGGRTAYTRALLKLSGEAFGSKGRGVDVNEVGIVAERIKRTAALGCELAVVIGGGNLVRGEQFAKAGTDRATADYMGMLATIMNGLALQDSLERMGVETRMLTALRVAEVAEPWIRRRAIRHLEKGRVVLLAGGTGNPYFTTDTTAALRASELGAEVLLKATKVDGVYDSDPAENAGAKRFERLSYMEVLRNKLGVMDLAAISLCMEQDLPIIVFDMKPEGNLERAVRGESIGTLVAAGERELGAG
jgi:uridylate kinase